MKQIYFLFAILLANLTIQSQNFSLSRLDGTPIANEETFEFDTTDEEVASVGYHVQNNSSANIYVRAQVVEINGSDGSNFQFCFGGDCFFSVSEGLFVPNNAVLIPAGGQNGDFDHFWNQNTTSDLISYRLRFVETNSFGTPLAGATSVYVNYTYNENLSIQDFNNDTFKVKFYPTVATDLVYFNVIDDTTMKMYDITGKLVTTKNLSISNSNMNVSRFNKGVYILTFEDRQGRKQTSKLIVK